MKTTADSSSRFIPIEGRRRFRLNRVWSDGQTTSATAPIPLRGRLTIGRGADADVAVPWDGAMSRVHALVRSERGQMTLQDLGSRNGVWLNAKRVQEAPLALGDVVRCGSSLFVMEHRAKGEPEGDSAYLGPSSASCRVRLQLGRAARANVTVLLRGPTGTGKEVAATILHQLSERPGPLVSCNCAAIPTGLAESTFFGHVRGAFSGATRDQDGLFVEAAGGTLFLDEVGELELSLQAKLLRVLEDRVVRPVGSGPGRPVDVRIVAATNASLASETFRPDLLARLAEYPIALAPLCERRADIPALLGRWCDRELSPSVMEAALVAPWPDNVRGLRGLANRLAVDVEPGRRVELADLPSALAGLLSETAAQAPGSARERLVDALQRAGGNVTEAARRLGVTRKTVYEWVKEDRLELAQFR